MNQRTLFWLLLVATLGYGYFMKQAVAPLTGKEIVAYELARTPLRAKAMLQEFAQAGKTDRVRQSLYLDYGFLLLYGVALFVGVRYATSLIGRVATGRAWVHMGNGLAWLGIVALVADAIENIALLRQLAPAGVTSFTAGLAWAAASLKFTCALVALLTAIVGFGYYGLKRLA